MVLQSTVLLVAPIHLLSIGDKPLRLDGLEVTIAFHFKRGENVDDNCSLFVGMVNNISNDGNESSMVVGKIYNSCK